MAPTQAALDQGKVRRSSGRSFRTSRPRSTPDSCSSATSSACTGRWRARAPLTPGRARQAHGHARALRARVAVGAGRRGLRDLRRGDGALHAASRARVPAARRRRAGRVPARRGLGPRRAEDHRRVPHRRGRRLARARRRRVRGMRALLPSGLRHEPRQPVDSRARGREGDASRRAAGWPTSGCGHGASTIIMAQAFPRSSFTGFDYHPASIEWARRAADKAGVGDRVTFEVARRPRTTRAPGTTW